MIKKLTKKQKEKVIKEYKQFLFFLMINLDPYIKNKKMLYQTLLLLFYNGFLNTNQVYKSLVNKT